MRTIIAAIVFFVLATPAALAATITLTTPGPFAPGDTINFKVDCAAPGDAFTFNLYNPPGSVTSGTDTCDAMSTARLTFPIPTGALAGDWEISVADSGGTADLVFQVGAPPPPSHRRPRLPRPAPPPRPMVCGITEYHHYAPGTGNHKMWTSGGGRLVTGGCNQNLRWSGPRTGSMEICSFERHGFCHPVTTNGAATFEVADDTGRFEVSVVAPHAAAPPSGCEQYALIVYLDDDQGVAFELGAPVRVCHRR